MQDNAISFSRSKPHAKSMIPVPAGEFSALEAHAKDAIERGEWPPAAPAGYKLDGEIPGTAFYVPSPAKD